MRSSRGLLTAAVLTLAAATGLPLSAQRAAPAPPPSGTPLVFRSSANLVSISAVVRDRRGKVLSTLTRSDFEILDGGERRTIADLHADSNAPASVALLLDGSGSMRVGGAVDLARRISSDVLAALDPGRDAAALLSFDTRLITVLGFTSDFAKVRASLDSVESFGATSLYDAVAGAAGMVAERAQNRRAVIVMTDGLDNASTYSPEQVAWIASRIDVPVYVFAVGDVAAAEDEEYEGRPGPLAQLARETGGDLFVVDTPTRAAAAVRRVTEELRHQYVIAFEPKAGGMRRVEIRTRKSDLRVQARSWYQGL